MSRVGILKSGERKKLFTLYHKYLSTCKKNKQIPVLKEFLDDLINNNKTFSKFTSKNIANRLEQERLNDGIVLWPKIVDLRNDINNYQPPSLENHIELFLGNLKKSIDTYDLLSSSNSKIIKQMLSMLATEILNMPLSTEELELVGREKEVLTFLLDYYPNIIGEIEKLSPEKLYTQLKLILNSDFNKYSFLIEELLKSNITEFDIQAIAYRKQQLSEFEKLLNNEAYFEELLNVNSKFTNENIWQSFFEKNKWIFGYSLNYVFTTSLDDKKLEQIVSGYDFNSSGKRVDGLLKTNGAISSLCFVEIKTHKDQLLKDIKNPYRSDCWQISDTLSGALAQIQKTVHKTEQIQKSKIEITTSSDDPTGEEIFLVEPKSFILIGNLKEFLTNHGVNQEKYKSFEIFRKNLINPEILTFDELYERAKYIVEKQS
jgi:hypothetical protein